MSNQQPRHGPSELLARNARKDRAPDAEKEVLEVALASFQSILHDEQRVELQRMKGSPCDAGSIIQFMHELDNIDANRRGKSMATTSHSLLQSVEQFYQIIETYVSSHPEIAALVWGSVKLAFMALGNFTSYFQKFSELLRGFDQLVPRFAEYQRLFPGSNRLRCATYEFQTAIISCCSQMILVTRRPWKKQLLVALSQSFQTEMRPFVDDIRSKAKEVKQEVELAKTQAYHQEQVLQAQERRQAGKSRQDVSRWFARSNKEMQALRQQDLVRASENKWNALLERLSHYDYAAAFKSARGKRHNGTAEWIFQTSEFESWYGNDASVILHVVGKIGSGKTVLTASIVDRLIRLRQQSLQAIAFFFVRFDDPPSQQSECITRSIVRQLFNHGSSDGEILRFLESSSDQFFDNDSLLALWSERIRSFKDFFLVLDGFDECALADRKAILSSISILSKACQKTTRVKVLVSSRISVKEEIDQANLTVIRMAIDVQNISADLTKYAEEILKDRISTREMVLGDGNLYSDILQAVGVGGEGMFLWVFLTLEDICSQTSDLEIRESLQSIPRNLPETFDRALQRIENNGKTNIAQTIFNWIATVRLPLTLDQLKESLAVKIGQRHSEPERYINNIARLTAWCENLVQVEETDETVRFSHHSIREYLLRNSKTFRVRQDVWDLHIGEICLTYLDFNDFKKALVNKSQLKSVDITNYPVGITTETVRKLMPGVKKDMVLMSARKLFGRSNAHSLTYEPPKDTQSVFGSVVTLGYPFFQYASDQWIFHTTRFRPKTAKTWKLWNSMVRTELTAWIDLHWEPKNSVPMIECWLPPVERSCPDFVRDHLVSWHKAILLAAFTEHEILMDQIFSVLQEHRVHPSPGLLRALMSVKQISIGFHSPLPLTLNDSDIHATVVYIFTRYIAAGGWLEDAIFSKTEKCDLEPTEKHLLGISQDVCTFLCEGYWAFVNGRHVGRLWAQISVSKFDDNLRETIASAFEGSDSHTMVHHISRSIQGKTIVNLVAERGEAWWLAIQDCISNNPEPLSSYSVLMRHSLRFSLKTRDEASVSLLLSGKYVDWTDGDEIDHETVQCAVQFEQMSRGLRKMFIDQAINPVIPTTVRSTLRSVDSMPWIGARDAGHLAKDNYDSSENEGDHTDSTSGNESQIQYRRIIRRRRKAKRELRLLDGSILAAAKRLDWDIALALYKHGARLKEAESIETDAFNEVLACIVLCGCCLDEADDKPSQVIYCREHVNNSKKLSEMRGK